MNNSSPDVSPRGGSASQSVLFSAGLSGETAEEFEWLTEEDIEEARLHPSASSLQEVSSNNTHTIIYNLEFTTFFIHFYFCIPYTDITTKY